MSGPGGPSADVQVAMYTLMSRIQQCDDRVRAMLMSGQIAIQFYPARGQEAISAGVSVNLHSDDYLVTTYRGIHDQIAKGMPFDELWAEYLGKATGSCKGKGGPMHITHPESGVMVTTGVVGGGLPIANGLALASQVGGDGRVTVCNFGDGAANIGAFHEALNLAAVWRLPLVFVCQNNRYGEHTAFADHIAVERISDRAAGYGMPGVTIDGNDPLAVHAAAAEAVDRARSGGGPTLIEAITYRFHGHFFGDSNEYMPPAELEAAMAADPVPAYRRHLLDQGVAAAEALDAIDAGISGELDEAVSFAQDSPFPDLDELLRDVYAEERG